MIFPIASAFFDQLADPGDRSHQTAGIQRHQYHFAVISGTNLLQRIGVFLRHEVVDRLNIAQAIAEEHSPVWRGLRLRRTVREPPPAGI